MSKISEILESLSNTTAFIHFDSDYVDWTKDAPVDLIIQANGQKYTICLDNTREIETLAASIYFFTRNSNIISWNIKNIISYFKKKTSIDVSFENIVYDLRIICSYFGLPVKKPEKFKDVKLLLDHLKKTKGWKNFEVFYEKVYHPLITKVIPDIENNCLVDVGKRQCVYSFYEIEGQSNGRMKNLKVLENGFMPHSMGNIEKENLKLTDDSDVFMYFDYKHMEVSVLEWVSKDNELSKILLKDEDLYESIWKILTHQDPSKEQRKICKNIFLPVIFGQRAKSLSKRMGISEKTASTLIYKLGQTFPVAFTWVNSQVADSNNIATDVFGRRRKFEEDELYKIKNFSIQSPSNMICLRKLIRLHEAIKDHGKICFHIHDGYCISCKKKNMKLVYNVSKDALEDQEELFPNLKLKTSCQYGTNLNKLKNIKEVINEGNTKQLSSN